MKASFLWQRLGNGTYLQDGSDGMPFLDTGLRRYDVQWVVWGRPVGAFWEE